MKTRFALGFALAAMFAVAAPQAQQAPPPPKPEPPKEAPKAPATIAGKWTVNLESPQGAMTLALEIKLDGKKVTGTLEGPQGPTPIEGEFAEGKLNFSIQFDAGGTPMTIPFTGELKPDGKLAGTLGLADMGTFPWSAERVKGER